MLLMYWQRMQRQEIRMSQSGLTGWLWTSGRITAPYGANWTGCYMLLENLIRADLGNVDCYTDARDKAKDFLLEISYENRILDRRTYRYGCKEQYLQEQSERQQYDLVPF